MTVQSLGPLVRLTGEEAHIVLGQGSVGAVADVVAPQEETSTSTEEVAV